MFEGKITPLVQSTEDRNLESVINLLSNGYSPNEKLPDEDTPLNIAAKNGDLLILRELINHGANINYGLDFPPLYNAVSNGHSDVVRELILAGASVNTIVDEDGDTVLLEAVCYGQLEVVKLLVDSGADVNVNGEAGNPLLLAIENRYVDIYEYLYPLSNIKIQREADSKISVFEQSSQLPKRALDKQVEKLVEEATLGSISKVEELISQEISINAVNSEGETALHAAAMSGHLKIVEILLKAGADPNCFDLNEDGETFETPLMSVFRTYCPNWLAICRSLIESGADCNLENVQGLTAIMCALSYPGSAEDVESGVKELVAAGANINAKDASGSTVLLYARMMGFPRVVSYLELLGAKGW